MNTPNLIGTIRRMLPWIGKMIANGAHLESVAPNDAIGAMQQAEAALDAMNRDKGGLSHAEIVDFFPILRNIRIGFEGDRLIDDIAFVRDAAISGSGAQACAFIVASLCDHTHRFATLFRMIGAMDSEHRAAFVSLIAAVSERGVK